MHVGDDVDLRWTAKGGGSPEWYRDLQLNLEAMISDAQSRRRRRSADLSVRRGFYEQANIVMRDTAAATGALDRPRHGISARLPEP